MKRHAFLFCAVLPILGTALSSQGASRNVQLLSRWDPGGTFNDVWGYVNPANGKEYALVGSTTGVYVIDTSNPKLPVKRGFFSSASSGWRSSSWMDIRTYRHWAYVVTEGGGGMKIIDLLDPDKPVQVKTWGFTGWTNSHNIVIDTQTGTVYTAGSRGGTFLIDIKTNPIIPRKVGTWGLAYVHDAAIQDGFAHFAEIFANRYRILDVRSLPTLRTLGSISVRSCHNVWPTRDNAFSVTTSETRGGGITIFDISKKTAPRKVATWRTGSTATIVHNAYMKDRLCHMSYYSEGYQGVDLSNPAAPVSIGFYDTTASTSGFTGVWGCYAFQPSGVIYVLDMRNGLHVLKPKATAVRYGSATPGTGKKTPTIHAFGSAWLGNTGFKIEVENALANSNTFFVVGAKRANTVVQGVTLLVDLAASSVVIPLKTDATGKAALAIPVPTSSAVNGAILHNQVIVRDAGANGLGFSATRGLTFEVFTK